MANERINDMRWEASLTPAVIEDDLTPALDRLQRTQYGSPFPTTNDEFLQRAGGPEFKFIIVRTREDVYRIVFFQRL